MSVEWVGIVVFLAVNINHTAIGLNQTADCRLQTYSASVRTSTTSQYSSVHVCGQCTYHDMTCVEVGWWSSRFVRHADLMQLSLHEDHVFIEISITHCGGLYFFMPHTIK